MYAPQYAWPPAAAPPFAVQPAPPPAYGQYLPDGSFQAFAGHPGAYAQPGFGHPPPGYASQPPPGYGQVWDYGQQAAPQYAGQPPAAQQQQYVAATAVGHQAAQYGGQQAAQYSQDPVEVFMQELGIQDEEVSFFGWIAEYGLQADTLPPNWTIHADEGSGCMYYVDSLSGSSSWESPIAESLRMIIDIGRNYLHIGTETYFQDQKQFLWDRRKQDLDAWHGPYNDKEGRSYYINSNSGTSTFQDPREEAQIFMELESTLLDALASTMPEPEVADLPGFGLSCEELERKRTAEESHQPEVWNLEERPEGPGSPHSLGSPLHGGFGSPTGRGGGGATTPRTNRAQMMLQVARGRSDEAVVLDQIDPSGAKSAYKEMTEKMKDLDYMVQDEAEAQFLLITRKFKKRREQKRKREREEHEAKYGEAWQKSLDAMEAAKREEEAKKKAKADAEEQRKASEHEKLQEEVRQAEKERIKEDEERRRAEEARQKAVAEKTAKLEEERRAEEQRQEEERQKQLAKEKREELLRRLKEVCTSHNVEALRAAIRDGEEVSLVAEVEPAKQALEEELVRRRAVASKARKAAEKLAGEFKTAQEAQEFGGAILAAQWRAAVKEVSKPFQEE